MTSSENIDVGVYFNQLPLDIEQDYANMLQRLPIEIHGLRRAVAGDQSVSVRRGGIIITSSHEDVVTVVFESPNSDDTQQISYADGVLLDQSSEETRQLTPNLEDFYIGLEVIRAMRLARFDSEL